MKRKPRFDIEYYPFKEKTDQHIKDFLLKIEEYRGEVFKKIKVPIPCNIIKGLTNEEITHIFIPNSVESFFANSKRVHICNVLESITLLQENSSNINFLKKRDLLTISDLKFYLESEGEKTIIEELTLLYEVEMDQEKFENEDTFNNFKKEILSYLRYFNNKNENQIFALMYDPINDHDSLFHEFTKNEVLAVLSENSKKQIKYKIDK